MAGIPRILIDQQLAEIGVKVTPARLRITTPHPEMEIETETPQMKIERKNPSFKINKKKINDEIGLKAPDSMAADVSNKGKNAASVAAGSASSDGDFLGDITKPGNRVVQLARRKTMQSAQKDVNVTSIPKSRPDVTWDPGYMKVKWSRHSVKIEWDGDYMPQFAVDPPYSVEIFLRSKPYFRITVEDGGDPYTAGRHVDKVL